jgi:hypothetical protein
MPILDQFVIADSITTHPSGTVDISGASWDVIEAETVPVQQESFALLISLLLTPDEGRQAHQLEVVISAPDGTRLSRMAMAIEAVPEERIAQLPEGDLGRIESVFHASGLVYPDYGRYAIELLWDGEQLRAPMRFRVSPPSTTTRPPAA